MSDKALRKALIKLAHDKPEIRGEILPLLKGKEAAGSIPSTFRGPGRTVLERLGRIDPTLLGALTSEKSRSC